MSAAAAVAKTTVLVTGANRGLGLEFVKQLLHRPNYEVLATCRNPNQFPDHVRQELLSNNSNSSLTVLPLDLLSTSSMAALPALLHDRTLDIVIHNAGVSSSIHPDEPILAAKREDLLQCFQCNTLGTLELTRLLLPFMDASSTKKMLYISSIMGSLAATEIEGRAAGEWTSSVSYRVSKAALNMSVRCFAAEIGGAANSGICFTLAHPGWVDTDMGAAGGRLPPLSPKESVQHVLGKVVDVMENSTHNGSFCNYDGSFLPW